MEAQWLPWDSRQLGPGCRVPLLMARYGSAVTDHDTVTGTVTVTVTGCGHGQLIRHGRAWRHRLAASLPQQLRRYRRWTSTLAQHQHIGCAYAYPCTPTLSHITLPVTLPLPLPVALTTTIAPTLVTVQTRSGDSDKQEVEITANELLSEVSAIGSEPC